MITGTGLIRTGIVPEPEALARILIFAVFSGIYISVWLALAIFFSVVSRHAATSALSSVAIWLFLTLFMGLVATGIAGFLYPLTGEKAYVNMISNYQLNAGLNRISPYYLYSEAVSTILNPNLRSLNIVSLIQESQNNALVSYLSLGQSILIIWPQIVALFALAAIWFAAAYITFHAEGNPRLKYFCFSLHDGIFCGSGFMLRFYHPFTDLLFRAAVPSAGSCIQAIRLDRLGNMTVHAGSQTSFHIIGKGIRRHGNDRYGFRIGPRHGADGPYRLQTIHHRHPQIHQDAVKKADRRTGKKASTPFCPSSAI
jgi:hypothetical protein